MKWSNLKLNRFHCDNWVWYSNDPSIPQKQKRGHESILVGRVEGGAFAHKIPVRDMKVSYEYV